MKTKIIIILTLCAMILNSKAQTIPNSGFESWKNVGGWFLNPDNWETNNSQLMTPVLPEINSLSGKYSLTISHDYSINTGYAKSRFPFNGHTAAIKVYVKCEMSTVDTVSVMVDVYSNRQITGNGKWTSATSISDWTLITIPITQKSSNGDSLEIRIIGGDSLQTSISLDEFSYDIISGINADASSVWTFYPNPFKEKLRYEIPGLGENQMTMFEIVDIYGRTVVKMNKFEHQGELDLPYLTNGAYILKITTEKEVLTRIMIKQ